MQAQDTRPGHPAAPLAQAVDTVPAIKRAVGSRVPIIVDGGVRRGTDILKA